jgi:hypothetical protein
MHDDDVEERMIEALKSMEADARLLREPSRTYLIKTFDFESFRDAAHYFEKIARLIPNSSPATFHILVDDGGAALFKIAVDANHPQAAAFISRLVPGDREPRH